MSASRRAAVLSALRAEAARRQAGAPASEPRRQLHAYVRPPSRIRAIACGLAPARAPETRQAMTDAHAIIAHMGADVRSLQIDPACLERFHLRRFGWTDVQIDSWFESACESASRPLSK